MLFPSNTIYSFDKVRVSMILTKNLGMILLAIWLIATGLIQLMGFFFAGLGILMAILAIAAGVLIGLER